MTGKSLESLLIFSPPNNIAMNKEEIQQKIDSLTRELKAMDSDNPRYPTIWDERVDLIYKRDEANE